MITTEGSFFGRFIMSENFIMFYSKGNKIVSDMIDSGSGLIKEEFKFADTVKINFQLHFFFIG